MTEKDYNPKQREMKSIKKLEASSKLKKIESPKKEIKPNKAEEKPREEIKKESPETQEKEVVKPEKKPEVPKIKKTEAQVNVSNFPISTKASSAVCKFINHKKIEVAIKELEEVRLKKKAIPSKGEYGHKKGKGMSGGIFATKTVSHFIILLKSLFANANELENPVISEAIANMGSRPFGRFGRTRKKRTHIKIVAKEAKMKEKLNKEKLEKK